MGATASTGAQIHPLQASEAWPANTAWGPDGLLVTAACGLGDARCSWTAPQMWRTGEAQPGGAALTAGEGRVDLLTVAPDGRSLVARNGSGLERWDLATGDVIERPLDAGGMLDLVHAPAGTCWSQLGRRRRPARAGCARTDGCGCSTPRR